MKKQAPKLIAVTLLITLAALLAVAAGIPEAEPGSSLAGEQTNTDTDPGDMPDDGVEDEIPSQDVPSDPVPFVPIPPEASALYRYTQSLWAEGGVALNGVHPSSDGTFVVITHSGGEGALNVNGVKTVSVARLESDGTVSALKHLNGGDMYIDSQLTSDGLTVALADEDRSYVHTLSSDLNADTVLELNRFTSGEIFALGNGYLLFAAGAGNTVYSVSGGAVGATGAVLSGTISAVYDFGVYYMLVIGGISGYSVVRIDSSLKTLSTVTVPGKELMSISPYTENGEQRFIAVEKNSTGVEIAKYDASYAKELERVGVGLADSAEAYMNGGSILLLMHATETRLYIVDGSLNFIASSSETMRGVTEIYDCVEYSGGYAVLYAAGDDLILVEISDLGGSVQRNISASVGNASLVRSPGGEYTVFYTADDSLKVIGI